MTGVFLFVGDVKAAETVKAPADNGLCWLRKDCEELRRSKGWVTGGFLEKEGECTGNANGSDPLYAWGKCLAGNKTNLQVNFGGVSSTAHIGDYIKLVYNYALIILAILSSVMIIVAGIQYVGSAGSQEMISGAKKKISGAIIGLALAYMSYTILNMINPNTMNLRLPQVYMIREIQLAKSCSDIQIPDIENPNSSQSIDGYNEGSLQSGGTIKGAIKFEQSLASLEIFKNIDNSKVQHVTYNPNNTKCGAVYSTLEGSCIGFNCDGVTAEDEKTSTCGRNAMCVCLLGGTNKSGYMCRKGFVGGNITLSSDIQSYVDEVTLLPVCSKGKYNYIAGGTFLGIDLTKVNTAKTSKNFVFDVSKEEIDEYCSEQGEEFKGFLLAVEMHDTGGKYNVNDTVFLATKSDCNGGSFSPKVGSVTLLGDYLEVWNVARIEEIESGKWEGDTELYNLGPIIDDQNNIIPYVSNSAICNLIINGNIDDKIKQASEGLLSTICYDEGGEFKCQNEFK